jgi:hypothetical protein
MEIRRISPIEKNYNGDGNLYLVAVACLDDIGLFDIVFDARTGDFHRYDAGTRERVGDAGIGPESREELVSALDRQEKYLSERASRSRVTIGLTSSGSPARSSAGAFRISVTDIDDPVPAAVEYR